MNFGENSQKTEYSKKEDGGKESRICRGPLGLVAGLSDFLLVFTSMTMIFKKQRRKNSDLPFPNKVDEQQLLS